MAAPAADNRRCDHLLDGSTRPYARRPRSHTRYSEPRERSIAREEGIEHGDGTAIARSFPRSGGHAPSVPEEDVDSPRDQASGSLISRPPARGRGADRGGIQLPWPDRTLRRRACWKSRSKSARKIGATASSIS